MLNSLFAFVAKALSETDNSPSFIRLGTFLLLILFIPALTFSFVWVTIYHPDNTIVYASLLLPTILGALGIKVWQKGKEE